MAVALELLFPHPPDAPVVHDRNEFIGFLSEMDVRRALEVGNDLSELNVEHIHVTGPC